MNGNIFQYLQDKKGKNIPTKVKLLCGLPLNKHELKLDIDSDCLFLRRTNLFVLPDNLEIFGNFSLAHTKLKKLPKNLIVHGYLDISYTSIRSLPKCLIVHDDLFCEGTPLANKINFDFIQKHSRNIAGKIYNHRF